MRPAEQHRSILVHVCAGIDQLARNPSCDQAMRDLSEIIHCANDHMGRLIAECVTGSEYKQTRTK